MLGGMEKYMQILKGSSIGKIYIVHNSEKWFNHKQRKTTEFCFPGCFRAGDRILLADDSNEDWWKVSTNPIPSPSCNFKTLLKYHKQSLKLFEQNQHVSSFYMFTFLFSPGGN